MVFIRKLTLSITFLFIGIVICQDVKQSVKNPVKGLIKSKRPGRIFDSKFYGSKFGSYKPEDFFGDDNSTKIDIPTSTVKISTLSPEKEGPSGLKGRKLPSRNNFQLKQVKSPIQLKKSLPSPAKLTAEGISESGTTETTSEYPETSTFEIYLTSTNSEE